MMAEKKAHQEAVTLVARGMLCNWLFASPSGHRRAPRTMQQSSFLYLCLLRSLRPDLKHSVANMTVFSLALMSDEASSITMGDAAHNLFWVTLGNALSGSVFVAVSYWFAGGGAHAAEIIHLE
ncbi:MAG: formate/nitrite transporter family protein [Parvularculaceae bacterium]